MIKIKLYEYQVNELIILLNTILHKFKEEKAKKENASVLSFIVIKISIYERIRDILQDSLDKE